MNNIDKFIEIAEQKGEAEALSFLSSHPEILQDKTDDGWSIIQLAANYGLVKIFDFCLQNMEFDNINSFTEHPITLAIQNGQKNIIEIALNIKNISKINSSLKFPGGDTLLHLAINFNQLETANFLHKLDNKLYLEKNSNDVSPLLLSIIKNQKDLFDTFSSAEEFHENYDELLIKKSIQFGNRTIFERLYPLTQLTTDELFAIANDFQQIEIVASILETGDFLPGKDQLTSIIDLSCKKYNTKEESLASAEVIEYLLDLNIPFSQFLNEKGQSAWMLCMENENIDVFKKLSQSTDNINSSDLYQLTPLHYAVESNNPYFVKTLLKKKANVNAKDRIKNTPLIKAVIKENKEIVDLLLQYMSSLDDLNLNQEHALSIALKKRNIPIVSSLIWAGAQISTRPYKESQEQSFMIFTDGKPENFSYHQEFKVDDFLALSKLGLNLNQKNSDGDTFMSHFIKNGYYANFKTLLRCAVNPNDKDQNGNTPIMLSYQKNSLDYMHLLLQRFSKIDLNIKNSDGLDVFDLCIKSESLEKIELLLNYKPDDLTKENAEKCLKFIAKHGDLTKYWDYFTQNLGNLEKYQDTLNNNLAMFALSGGNVKNFFFLISKTDFETLTSKNSLNKNLFDLIELVPDNEIKTLFNNYLTSYLHKKSGCKQNSH